MFGFFKKKISSNQVDLYVSDKILGVAKKVVAIVEAEDVTIVDGGGVIFLAAGLFLNATYLADHGRKSEAIRIKVIGFVKCYLDSTDDKDMLERLSENTRWFSQGNMSGSWFVNQVIGDLCMRGSNSIHQQILPNETLEILVAFFRERTATISDTLSENIYPFYNPA